jgi:cytosine/adenosine deaminase-related metal-dependent hydrolase
VTLVPGHPALLEWREDEILDSWIFAAGRDVIDCVWRASVRLVSAARHRERDAIVSR